MTTTTKICLVVLMLIRREKFPKEKQTKRDRGRGTDEREKGCKKNEKIWFFVLISIFVKATSAIPVLYDGCCYFIIECSLFCRPKKGEKHFNYERKNWKEKTQREEKSPLSTTNEQHTRKRKRRRRRRRRRENVKIRRRRTFDWKKTDVRHNTPIGEGIDWENSGDRPTERRLPMQTGFAIFFFSRSSTFTNSLPLTRILAENPSLFI